MPNVEIIGFAPSTYVRTARMVCEEKAIPYELKPAAPHSPDVAAIHPFGKIPVMRHGDFELCESKAIATYLDLTFPGPKLIPTDPRHAALTEQWVSLVNTRMDGTMIRTYLFAYIFPKTDDGQPDRKAIDAVLPALSDEIGLLDRAVANGGYLAGDSFTFADINVMPILFYLQKFPESAAAIAAAKPLADYYARLAARPSFQNTTPPPPPPRQARP
ncbi:MAG TPA: glutathione S-transferase family protein [Xanthobacteraceae bacterium]|nr:glutathione S-transferase family protein [Xanthobacteraceae bacterium]